MEVDVKVSGLSELAEALTQFAPKLRNRCYKDAIIAAAMPELEAAQQNAPIAAKDYPQRYPGELRDSLVITTRVRKYGVVAKIGPSRSPGGGLQAPGTWGLMVEFGSINNRPMPYLRPAFEATKEISVQRFAEVLRDVVPTMVRK